jgi:hypothetical protein
VMLRYGKPNRYIVGHGKSRLGTGTSKDVTCDHCAAVVRVLGPARIKNRRFCSTDCRDKYRAVHTGAEHPSYKRVEYECPVCGVAYPARPGLVRKGKTFCSAKCGQRSRSLKLSALQLVPGSWSYGRRMALRRDRFMCALCDFDIVLHVHHIKSRSNGGDHDPANLVTLCPNHHTMVHRKLIGGADLAAAIAARTPAP